MAAQSPGIAVYRDELVAWVAGFDAYRAGRGGDRQDMLSMWSGTPLKVDRKGKPSIVAPRPTVSIVGGVQPDRLHAVSAEAGQDGFLDRFLWAYPEVGVMRFSDDEVSEAAVEAINALFARLRAAPDDAHPDGYPVRLDDDALAAFRSWHDENADLQEDAPPLLRGVFAKLPAQLLRLALVLHCLEHPDPGAEALVAETMAGAIALVEFHRAHAAKVMRRFRDVGTVPIAGLHGRIIRIIRIIQSTRSEEWASRSDISKGLGNVPPDRLTAALDELVAKKVLETRTSKTATKPKAEYRLAQAYVGSGGHHDTPDPDETDSLTSDYSNHSDYSLADCGRPMICAVLGPCRVKQEHGACPLTSARTRAQQRREVA